VPVLTYLTEAEAAEKRCPVARTFPDGKRANCDGPACILWRFKTILASDPLYQSAVKREEASLAQEDGTGKPGTSFHKQAVANVAIDPEGHGVVQTRGFCGLGGRP
jgi:hypothetical protein